MAANSLCTKLSLASFVCSVLLCAVAQGAEITLGDYTLSADEIEIDDSSNSIRATGSAGVAAPDGKITAQRITITTDDDWKTVVSAAAREGVKFEFVTVRSDAEGNQVTRRLAGTCRAADWSRDPSWKGEASEDKGIAVLTGAVSAKVKGGAENEATGEIACETLTLYINEGRYVAKGGSDGRAEVTLEFPAQGEKTSGDSD